jgi:hypothetical protein
MGFFHLKSDDLVKQAETGDAIKRVSDTVFQTGANSEWAKFNRDTRKWLFDNGYRYDGTPDGKIPKTIDIIPVYDTETKMHVRIPWSGDLANIPPPQPESYGGSGMVLLARYFMRRCR